MYSSVTRFIDTVVRIFSRDFSALLVLILVILVMAETISRYVFNSPLMIVDEFGAYILVTIVIVGAADTWADGGHINIDTFLRMLPEKLQRRIQIFTYILVMLFTPLLIYAGIELVSYSGKFGIRSETWLRTPLVWPQLMILLGFVLLFLQIVSGFIKLITTKPQDNSEQ